MARATARVALPLLASLLAAAGGAQTVKETLDVTRQAREAQRRVLVSGAMILTDGEAKSFWPLYDDYEKQRRAIDERADRMGRALPPRKLVRFFQIENKLDAAVHADTAQKIPLAP